MIAYKLFRVRRDGTLGSLFINRCGYSRNALLGLLQSLEG